MSTAIADLEYGSDFVLGPEFSTKYRDGREAFTRIYGARGGAMEVTVFGVVRDLFRGENDSEIWVLQCPPGKEVLFARQIQALDKVLEVDRKDTPRLTMSQTVWSQNRFLFVQGTVSTKDTSRLEAPL
ncbi:hypothetical protein B0H13DRAFT_2312049 [Mycena leptocephala]|nr:hypothetical protein B0H13DRAFT_2312049 [Mycena leptocephala]